MAGAQAAPSAADLLAQSIAWHDPEGRWAGGAWRLTIAEARPDATGEASATYIEIDNGRGRFAWSSQGEGARLGSDTWYFYLNRETPALVGYRFFHDEAKGDGEYILLDGEVADGGLRLPRQRAWYTNQERKHLGTDTLTRIEPLGH